MVCSCYEFHAFRVDCICFALFTKHVFACFSKEIMNFDGVVDTEIVIGSDGVSSTISTRCVFYFPLSFPQVLFRSVECLADGVPKSTAHGIGNTRKKKRVRSSINTRIGNDTVETAKIIYVFKRNRKLAEKMNTENRLVLFLLVAV